jgi:hypothetical protein
MTSAEWEKFSNIEAALARIEERLSNHIAVEDSSRARLAPWVSALAAVVASGAAVFMLFHR